MARLLNWLEMSLLAQDNDGPVAQGDQTAPLTELCVAQKVLAFRSHTVCFPILYTSSFYFGAFCM